MEERTKLGLGILEAALLLGVVGNVLLRVTPWGINATLAVIALLVAMITLLRQKRSENLLSSGGRLLIGFVCVFALALAWRDSPVLKFLNLLSIAIALALVALDAGAGRVMLAGLSNYFLGVLLATFNAAFGGLQLLLSDIKWAQIPRGRWTRQAGGVARGLFIAVPLILVFGALFMAADAVFNDLVNRSFAFDGGEVWSHILLTVVFAWLAAGFLGGAVLGNELTRTSLVSHSFQNTIIVKPSAAAKESGQSSVTDAANLTVDESQEEVSEANERHASTANAKNAGEQAQGESTVGAENATTPATRTKRFLSLGIVEIGVTLGLLNTLFFIFVLVQMRYLLGDERSGVERTHRTYTCER